MPATSFYKNAAHDGQNPSSPLDIEINNDDDLPDLDMATVESDLALAAQTTRRSTDLVRLYLQEIGRVRLLGRDEEVAEAQKVQRYLRMRVLLSAAAAEGDAVIMPYSRLMEVQERLTAELGHRPSLERWATTAGISLPDLKPTLANGKRRWAEIANLTVEELDQVQTQGT
ncbi:MAG: RNA polymerase sigma factor, RpoD/SigA family, partial [Dolichospermum sp.]|nr:RNA polymerase sigma factor, RpoD/SigA family [Dolichospermum sp.]